MHKRQGIVTGISRGRKYPIQTRGKIVVDNDVNKLSSLEERATQLSMEDVKVLEKSDILTLEPYCKFDNALHVPVSYTHLTLPTTPYV